jgi:hypothetical protein
MSRGLQILMVLPTLVGLSSASTAELWGGQINGRSEVNVWKDFVADFDSATVENALACAASTQEKSGKVALPGIFLHPRNAEDAVVTYSDVSLPPGFLVFRIGFRDGVVWDDTNAPPNGVRFKIAIDGQNVLEEEVTGPGWHARAIDLRSLGGKTASVSFATNAISGNTSYDWAVFADPVILWGFPRPPEIWGREENDVGIALCEIDCEEASAITLYCGDASESATLAKGTHWIPLNDVGEGEARLRVEGGRASLVSVMAGPYAGKLSWPEVKLGSPLVTAGRPYDVVFETKNTGRGVYRRGYQVNVKGPGIDTISPPRASLPIGSVAPGATERMQWNGVIAPEPGDHTLRAGPVSMAIHVFMEEPALPKERPEKAYVQIPNDEPILAAIGNPSCRLAIVRDASGEAYGIAETWSGKAWQRVGSVYPLMEVVTRDEKGNAQTLRLHIDAAEGQEKLVLKGACTDSSGQGIPCSLTFEPDPDAPRIRFHCEATASEDTSLLAFRGPALLAGDRAYGMDKDFAIFPGLEYLEGDEESSSTRDLAYPHSDRRVPAPYKVAAPVMAVQGEDAVFALLWDPHQEWAPGQALPAARFLAPAVDSGAEYVHMSLFAPGVGEYLDENTYQAKQPYPVKAGSALKLSGWLVMDHASRYGADTIVHGPHKGGLVLMAMKHLFDVQGLPEPSPQPRDWEAEKALCRDAYLNAVWVEDPPGFRHCAGWSPGLYVGHCLPLLLDARDGAAAEIRTEIERRVNAIVQRAIAEHGKHYLWSNAGCHILQGELPYYHGYLPESLQDYRRTGFNQLDQREDGLWVWRPAGEKYESLGKSGDHTLGQASWPAFTALRAARLTGDPELAASALDAMAQMERYEVPRGAQMWECPLYQPDILASARAVRAYCEAYRLTGDPAHLDQARYWAWTGLPFLYLWELDSYPTMRYNVISVIGSTFYSHSWIGLPVVWCGLVYGYGLLDLAEFDDSFPWRTIAQGIVNSAMWQQYPDGPSEGCYPDSWNMVRNKPNPADINPENILVNEFRLRGLSPEIQFRRLALPGMSGSIMFNTSASIASIKTREEVAFALEPVAGFAAHTTVAPVPEPASVTGAGERVPDSDALLAVPAGWLYDTELQMLVLKHTPREGTVCGEIAW